MSYRSIFLNLCSQGYVILYGAAVYLQSAPNACKEKFIAINYTLAVALDLRVSEKVSKTTFKNGLCCAV